MSYVYQEFPRWLYKADGERLLVQTDAEKTTALTAGWALQPVCEGDPVPVPVVALPKRRGRRPKGHPPDPE